jgi:hypothetical protein
MRAFGEVAVDDVRNAVEEILDHPWLRPGVTLLIDNREVTSRRTVNEVAVITAAFVRLFHAGCTRLAIVTSNELVQSQVFAGFASTEGATAKVFTDEAAAREWLERPGSSTSRG